MTIPVPTLQFICLLRLIYLSDNGMIKPKKTTQQIDMRIHLTNKILTNNVLSFESFIVSRKNDSKRYFDTGSIK